MEDWLADYQYVKFNLAESGFVDFTLGEFLNLCTEDIKNLEKISLINPDTRGSTELREEILKCYEEANIENVLVTVGVSEALFAFFNVVLNPGDEVIVEFPEFQTLYELPSAVGCKIKFLQLEEENRFIPEPDKINELITKKTKLIIINTPHNPTGSIVPESIIERICEIAKDNGVYLLFDEHYKFLPLTEGSRQLKSGYDICKDLYDRVAAVGSITKSFGLNGLRVGWLLSNREIIEACREFKHYLTHVTPPINDYLAVVALKNKERIIKYVKRNILKNIKLLNVFMEKKKDCYKYIEPKGGLVCFPKLRNETDSNTFCRKLLKNYDLSLLPGSAFGMQQYFRLNFGLKSVIFSKALKLLENIQISK